MAGELGRRRLGKTGLDVSALGLGSGGPSRLGQRRGTDVQEVRRLVGRARELGINMIDTAPLYGSSETLLGEALTNDDHASLILTTKFNPMSDDRTVRTEGELRRSLESSLTKLGRETIDVFYLHAVPPGYVTEVWDVFGEELTEAVDAGLVRFTGISEAYAIDHDHAALRQAMAEIEFDVAMVGYNLLSPSARALVFDDAVARDIGIVIMCAVRGVITDAAQLAAVVRNWKAVGLLDDSVDPLDPVDPLGWVVDDEQTISGAAYKFALEPDAVGSVLTGTASVGHLEENVAAATGQGLNPEILERLLATFSPVQRNVGAVDTRDDFVTMFGRSHETDT